MRPGSCLGPSSSSLGLGEVDGGVSVRGTHVKEFRCFLMKGGSVLEGVQQDLRIEADRNVLSVDYHTAYHVMGTKWTDAGDNPTNGSLATANKWSATYDTDLIPMVELIVNSPLDTSAIA